MRLLFAICNGRTGAAATPGLGDFNEAAAPYATVRPATQKIEILEPSMRPRLICNVLHPAVYFNSLATLQLRLYAFTATRETDCNHSQSRKADLTG